MKTRMNTSVESCTVECMPARRAAMATLAENKLRTSSRSTVATSPPNKARSSAAKMPGRLVPSWVCTLAKSPFHSTVFSYRPAAQDPGRLAWRCSAQTQASVITISQNAATVHAIALRCGEFNTDAKRKAL